MPQGAKYDENGKMIWPFDICCEFDCNVEHASAVFKVDCKGDFTKEPCVFVWDHRDLNFPESRDEAQTPTK